MRFIDRARRLICGVLCVLLAACGGGGGGGGGSAGGDFTGRTGRLPTIQGPLAQFVAVTSRKRLISFDRGASELSSSIPLLGSAVQSELVALEIRQANGSVLSLDAAGFLHTVDSTTGVASTLGQISEPLQGTKFGMELMNAGEVLRITSNTGTNLLVRGFDSADFEPEDFVTTRLDALPAGIGEIAGTQNLVPCGDASLMYFINVITDELLVERGQSGRSALARIGPLGLDASEVGGFEIFQNPDRSDSAVAIVIAGGEEALYTINLQTGRATREGTVPGLLENERVIGLAALPQRNAAERMGDMVAVTESGNLISFDAEAPQTLCVPPTIITGLQDDEQIVDIDRRPKDGKIYALTDQARLYTLDLGRFGIVSLQATLEDDPAGRERSNGSIFDTIFDGEIDRSFNIEFIPRDDLLEAVGAGRSLSINPDTGSTQARVTFIGDPAGMIRNPLAIIASYGPSPDSTRPINNVSFPLNDPRIQGIRANEARADAVASTGISYVSSLTKDGRSSVLFTAPLDGEPPPSPFLTASIASRKLIGGGEPILGFAYTPNETATVYAVTTDNRLLGFKTITPSQPDVNVAVTGLMPGENVLSIDIRVSDDELYAITDRNRIYTIDMQSGAATFRVALAPAANDDNPFAGLAGNHVEIDFSPVSEQLRVTGVGGQNLRVDVDTGVTITDPPLNTTLELPAPPQFRGAVYLIQRFFVEERPIQNAPTLFSVDVANDRILEAFRDSSSTSFARDRGALENVRNSVGEPRRLNVTDVLLARPGDPNSSRSSGSSEVASAIISSAGGIPMFADLIADSIVGFGNVSFGSPVPLPNAADSITGFAVAGQQRYVLLNGQSLLVLNASTTQSIALTGLQAEALQSIAVRNDGSLYGLAASGNIYFIDPTTGSASVALQVLGATLRGSKFYLTFNPADDQPTILSDAGQTVAVDFATGAATERRLTYAAPVASASAYTNNVVGSTRSSRLILDMATVSLRIAGDVKSSSSSSRVDVIDGSSSFLGVLDNGEFQSLSPLAAFDAAAGDDSQTLVALHPMGAAQSILYRTAPSFPKLMRLGAIGTVGTQPVRGLTSRIK